MMPFLLDTNIIIDVLRRRNERHLLIERFLEQRQPLASCPIILTEVYSGMRPQEEKATRAFLRSLLFLPVTGEIAEEAGRLMAPAKTPKILAIRRVQQRANAVAKFLVRHGRELDDAFVVGL